MKGYRGILERYMKYCKSKGRTDILEVSLVEEYIWEMWRKGRLKQMPESFRLAIRKWCDIMDSFSDMGF